MALQANCTIITTFQTPVLLQRIPMRASLTLFGILRIPLFVNHRRTEFNVAWLAHQWDERSVLGHAQIYQGRLEGYDPEIDTAQTSKHWDGRLALLEKSERLSLIGPRKKCLPYLSWCYYSSLQVFRAVVVKAGALSMCTSRHQQMQNMGKAFSFLLKILYPNRFYRQFTYLR